MPNAPLDNPPVFVGDPCYGVHMQVRVHPFSPRFLSSIFMATGFSSPMPRRRKVFAACAYSHGRAFRDGRKHKEGIFTLTFSNPELRLTAASNEPNSAANNAGAGGESALRGQHGSTYFCALVCIISYANHMSIHNKRLCLKRPW